jgi:hypothetical protein
MSETIIMSAIREFVKTCPHLKIYNKGLGVDYLGEESTQYAIESVPAAPILKRYLDGSTYRQQVFVFSSRESYGVDVRQNLENLGFFQLFADWLKEKTDADELPDLGAGKRSLRIEPTTTGYAFDTSVSKAKYQIECRLVYLQNGG